MRQRAENITKLKRAFSAKECLAPKPFKEECSGPIIQAHTVPKSGSLRKIARGGKVYSFTPPRLDRLESQKGLIYPQLTSINRASTFTGFCSSHDNNIFRNLEDQEFTGSHEQCFLLGYRAVCYELFTKRAAASLFPVQVPGDQGKYLRLQYSAQSDIEPFGFGLDLGHRDISYHKSDYDQVLINENFQEVRSYIIELESPPSVMCGGAIFPEQDFAGNSLQKLEDPTIKPHLLCFTSFHGGSKGVIVFTWLPHSDTTCGRFVGSLAKIPENLLASALLRLFFEFCENMHIQPDWWDGLDKDKQTALVTRLSNGVNPTKPRLKGCLQDDTILLDEWEVSRVRTVGFKCAGAT